MATSKRRQSHEVLRYTQDGVGQGTVRAHYLKWRAQQQPPLPVRCDNPDCRFHTEELTWNGAPIKPILDHIDGNRTDNRPEKLRLLCPNCDSQLGTRGGGNKGRIQRSTGGFSKVSRDGRKDYEMFLEPQMVSLNSIEPKLDVEPEKP